MSPRWLWFALVMTLLASPVAAQDATPRSRAAAAERAYVATLSELSTGRADAEDVHAWSVRWMTAELEVASQGAAQRHLDRMTTLETAVHAMVASGVLTASAELACAYYVIEARGWRTRPPR